MSDELQQNLRDYDHAVSRASETYRGMSADERAARQIAGDGLRTHAPSNRTAPTCTGCNGAPWPCAMVQGAIVMSNPHNN
ncbi:hypothetical protein [Streptomyces sp. NPDC048350]|uniref:hypothetical protein n=1 Tax=Streptomyces sp. NPDC048350 TaxID=3365538 RepID=UPI0037170434